MSRSFVPPRTRTQRALPPEDTHIAILYSVVDLGTHKLDGQFAKDQNGNQKYSRKIVLTWELPEARHVFKEGGQPEPFSISQTYTFSLGKKANLRADVEAWVGKLTDDEAAKFDILELLGQPCLLGIGHDEKNGINYANIISITKLPKGVKCPPAYNPQVSYHIDDLEGGNFQKLPKWQQEKIKLSEEFVNGDEGHPDADDRPPVDDRQADEYADELERRQRELNR